MNAQIKLIPGNLYKVIDSLAFSSHVDPYVDFSVWKQTKYVFRKNSNPIVMFLYKYKHKYVKNVTTYHFLINANVVYFVDTSKNEPNNINNIRLLNYLEILP